MSCGCPRGYECCPLVLLGRLPDPLLERKDGRWECVTINRDTLNIVHGVGNSAEEAILNHVDEMESERTTSPE